MSVRFRHTLRDLEADFKASERGFRVPASRAVRQVARRGQMDARRMSRRYAGPHGRTFHKRITLERMAPLTYEYGTTAPKSEYVGVGYRSGSGGLEFAQSSDGLAIELENRLRVAQRGSWSVT